MRIEWETDANISSEDITAAADAPFFLTALCCREAEGVRVPLCAHVTLTDDAGIREINRAHRGIDSATDVLSFPTVSYKGGRTAGSSEKRLRAEYDPDAGGCMLGDIVISVQRARAQAEEYGHGAGRELCYLLAHGLFHLMGYDHMQPDEQREMRKMEEKALNMAGVSREDDNNGSSDEELLALAVRAKEFSYSPYSRYRVGAALKCADGRVFTGCNIENASFGATSCAERTALFKAVSEGEREFTAIAIAADDSAPYPCGICRQALNEFAPRLRVMVTWGEGNVEKTTLPELLPHGFGPADLK